MTEVGELATETCYVPNLNDLEELDNALSLYSPGKRGQDLHSLKCCEFTLNPMMS